SGKREEITAGRGRYFKAMTNSEVPSGTETVPESVAERLSAAARILEALVEDLTLLADVPAPVRVSPLAAAGEVYAPYPISRCKFVREATRRRKAEQTDREEAVLHTAGIRSLRRQSVFALPNVFPPENHEQETVDNAPDFREALAPQNCY